MSNIRIDIASEFKDRGFKQAQKATSGLDRQLKTLNRTLLSVFSTRQIYQFGKASVKAFNDDQKAAFRLTQTLDNLGLAFEDARVTKFISDLEGATGILDDQLRPAMQSLVMTTGSVTKSQELLSLAIDMSRATGADLTSVANDLSKAYVGQTRSLAKYNLGLARTELQTKTFTELQAILTKQFSGQSAAYLETYAGKIGVLNVAYANMQETIGEGLVDAFMTLSGDSGIGGSVKALDVFGNKIADVSRGVANLISGFSSFGDYGRGLVDFVKSFSKETTVMNAIASLGRKNKPLFFPTAGDPAKQERARKTAEQAAIKRAKELAALQTKAAREAAKRAAEQAKKEKEAAMLKRAGTVFDIDNIQIVAALQGKVTEEQRLRLTALFAIQNDNAKAAEALTLAILASNKAAFEALGVTFQAGDSVETLISKIIKAQANLFLINTGIDSIKEAKNPFANWPDIIAALLAQISQLQNAINNIGAPTLPVPGGTPGGTPGYDAVPAMVQPGSGVTFGNQGNPLIVPIGTSPEVFDNPAMTLPGFENTLANPQLNWEKVGDTYVTNVTVEGSVMSESDLLQLLQDEIYKAQRAGTGIIFNSVAL